MAYNNANHNSNGTKKSFSRKDNNSGNTTEKVQRPKKKTFVFPITSSYTVKDRQGEITEIDPTSVEEKLIFLQENGVFDFLTTNINIANSLLYGDANKKGSSVVGFINNIDTDTGDVSVTIFGTSVDKITALNEEHPLIVNTRIIAYNGEFRSFNGFYLE